MAIYLTVDKGTMYGGKSSTLEKLWKQYKKRKNPHRSDGKLRILVLKHAFDNRYAVDHIVTHDGKKIPCTCVSELMNIDPSNWDVILIDEGQFFADLFDWISTYFRKCSTRIHIAGLNGDKNQNNFGDINKLSPFCSDERIHYGICAVCGDRAPFTRDRYEGSETIAIGGDDRYFLVCAAHLDTPISEIESYIDYQSS